MVAYLLQVFFDIFFDGTHPIRIALFIAWVTFLYVLGRTGLSVKRGKMVRIVTVFSFVALFLLGVFAHLFVVGNHGMAARDRMLFFDRQEITGTRLTNNHFGKSVIGVWGDQLLTPLVSRADTGRAIVVATPKIIVFSFYVFFLLSIIGSAITFLTYSKEERGWPFFILFSLSTFILLKNGLDGGILNDNAAAALTLFVGLVLVNRGWFYRTILVFVPVYAFVAYLLYQNGFYQSFVAIQDDLIKTGIMLALGAILFSFTQKLQKRLQILLIVLSCVVILIGFLWNLSDAHEYRSTQAEGRVVRIGLYDNEVEQVGEKDIELKPYRQIGNLKLYTVISTEGIRVGDLLDKYKISDRYFPVTVEWKTCAPALIPEKINFRLTSQQKLLENNKQFISRGIDESGWFMYDAFVLLPACSPRPMDMIAETLREKGLEHFIVSKIEGDVSF
ncbi:MAG TPA: hypothetical protein VK145_02520 [Candidatus Nanoarchaeia archaeon]|nr:hypothetical protein [Candidatus Nanoarchaeia archaeon]